MNAKEKTYSELLTQYRAALSVWTEAKALYWPDGPEFIAAAIHLEEIENTLEKYRMPKAA